MKKPWAIRFWLILRSICNIWRGQVMVVVGAYWGDEGKGKVVDGIGRLYDIIVRFGGGANAGHTVFTPDGRKVVCHLIPCGVAWGKTCVIGRGVLFSLSSFLREYLDIAMVLGGVMPVIYIDTGCTLFTPYHRLFEFWGETLRNGKIGTTGRAIGAMAAFDKLRYGPKVGDLFSPVRLEERVAELYFLLLPIFEEMLDRKEKGDADFKDVVIPTPEEVVAQLLLEAQNLPKDCVIDTRSFLLKQIALGKKILLEGAQAAGLDSKWGTWPFVSAGDSVAVGASLGTGLPMYLITRIMMVGKALPSRVGSGPFPSEMWDRDLMIAFGAEHMYLFSPGKRRDDFLADLREQINMGGYNDVRAKYFGVLGLELGASTSRVRSLGFSDLPWLRYSAEVNGATEMALTRLDMLSGIDSMQVAVAYKYEGEVFLPGQMPVSAFDLDQVEPVYEHWPCWEEDISGISKWRDLPREARAFIKRIEAAVGVPITVIGTGPGREALIRR
jgi:adenylosuccinate synthase